jgi:cytochrome c556
MKILVRAGVTMAVMSSAIGLATAQTPTTAPTPTTPAEIIAFRKAGYKHIGDLFGGMKKGIDAGADVAPFAPQAKDIADWARKVPTLFPPGTETGGETHALPAIWQNKPDFEAKAGDLAAAADKLSTVAATGDKAAFEAQWKATGAACGACHREYRARL